MRPLVHACYINPAVIKTLRAYHICRYASLKLPKSPLQFFAIVRTTEKQGRIQLFGPVEKRDSFVYKNPEKKREWKDKV